MKQILLTNDDGFDAAGLVALQNMLKSNLSDVRVLTIDEYHQNHRLTLQNHKGLPAMCRNPSDKI